MMPACCVIVMSVLLERRQLCYGHFHKHSKENVFTRPEVIHFYSTSFITLYRCQTTPPFIYLLLNKIEICSPTAKLRITF